jgi:hypothetical protein
MSTQPAQRSRPLVAIINTALESIELLEELLADEDMDTVSAYVFEFKRGERDLRAFFEEHRPDVVVFDIAIPYVENWRYFQDHVLKLNVLPEQCFVLTTTNRTVLEMLVGPTSVCELVGRPYDLDAIVTAIKHVMAAGAE